MSTQLIGQSVVSASVPRRSPFNDLTLHSRLSFPVQQLALPRDHQYAGTWWYFVVGVLSVTSSA